MPARYFSAARCAIRGKCDDSSIIWWVGGRFPRCTALPGPCGDGRLKLSRAFATTNAIWLLSLSYHCSISRCS